LDILVSSASLPGGSPGAVGPIDTVNEDELLGDFDVKCVGALRCARGTICRRSQEMADWVRQGRVAWIFEENFVPDDLMGADNLTVEDPEILKGLAMKDYESGFAEKVQPGDFFVGKSNYGYARAHAGVNITMKALGIGGIIADSFTLGYPAGAANNAYPLVLTCPGISQKVSRWDLLEVDFKSGVVKNLTTEEIIQGIPTPEDMVRMIEVGGLEADVRRNLEAQKASKST
jgi:3-isopropylmalate/(R)-2-methylmalate dehydratase small subunit